MKTRELKLRIPEDIYGRIAREAALHNIYAADRVKEILTKIFYTEEMPDVSKDVDSFESGHKDLVVRLTVNQVEYLQKSATKSGFSVDAGKFAARLLDKIIPSDTMSTVVFQKPKGLTGQQLKDFLHKKVEELK